MPAGKTVTFKSGSGTTNGSGGVLTITTGTAVGTNTAGANLILTSGRSTGTNTAGNIVFQVATASTISSTNTNSLGNALSITSGKALQIHPTSGAPTVSGDQVDIDFFRAGDRIFNLASGGTNFSLTGSNATNVGQQGSIVIVNAGSSSPTVTWETGNVWYFENGNAITIPTTNDLIHIFSYYIYASGKVLISGSTSFSQYTA
jgi:hypothetical protein